MAQVFTGSAPVQKSFPAGAIDTAIELDFSAVPGATHAKISASAAGAYYDYSGQSDGAGWAKTTGLPDVPTTGVLVKIPFSSKKLYVAANNAATEISVAAIIRR